MSDSEDLLFRKAPTVLVEEDKRLKKKTLKKSKRRTFKKEMKPKKVIPNHFLAFKIHDSVIRDNVAQFQKRAIEKNPLLNKTLTDLRTLHVTLAVTHLGNEERIVELQKKLMDWSENNMKTYFKEPIHLTFTGVGTFGKDVVFVKVKECENYKRLCLLSSALNNLLSDSGFYREYRKTFTPHLTLLKLGKNRMFFKNNMKEISSDIRTLSNCDDDFGSQDVEEIQLLSMTAKNEDDGYYKCLWEAKTKELVSNAREKLVSNAREKLASNAREKLASNAREKLAPNAREKLASNAREKLASNAREKLASNAREKLAPNAREELVSNARELVSNAREELESEASQPNEAGDEKRDRSSLRYAFYTIAGICPLIVILSFLLNKR